MKNLMLKRLLALLYFGNLVGLVLYWWITFGSQMRATTANTLIALGHISGILAVVVILVELLMMARVRLIERAYSLDELTRIHRWNGYAAFGLMLLHIIFITLGYQHVSFNSFIGQIIVFTQSYEDVFNALLGAILFFVVTVTSVRLARKLARYEIWYFVHLTAYLGVVLTFGHQVHTGPDFISHPGFTLYWYIMYGVVALLIAYYRFAVPLLTSWRLRLKVSSVTQETHDSYTVQLEMPEDAKFDYEPGQFAVWYVLNPKLWWQGHPFSMSSIPGEPLAFTVKASGDYTRDLASVKPGTPVWIDGPHGKFTLKKVTSRKLLMIAGGVGITPLYGLLKSMASGYKVTLLYACKTPDDVIFRKELDELARAKGVTIMYLFSKQPGVAPQSIDKKILTSLGYLADHDVFLCGPPVMMDAVTQELLQVGIPKKHIYSERFDY